MFYYSDTMITGTAYTSQYVITGEVMADPVDFQLEEVVSTPWERSYAAYKPCCRPRNQFLAPRWLLRQQRPRDGLHAQN